MNLKTVKDFGQLPSGVVGLIWHLIKRYKVSFVLSCIGCFAIAIEHTALPYATKLLVDSLAAYESGDIIEHIRYPIVFGAVVWLGNDILWRLAGFSISYFRSASESYIKQWFTLIFIKQKANFFTKYQSGDLFGRALHTAQELPFIVEEFLYFVLPCILNTIIAAAMLLFVNPWISALVLTWLVIHLCVCFYFLRRNMAVSAIYARSMNEFHAAMQDSVGNHLAVRSFNGAEFEKATLDSFAASQRKKQRSMLYLYQTMIWILAIISFIINGPVLFSIQINMYKAGQLTIGDMAMILQLVFNLAHLLFDTTAIFGEVIQTYGVVKKNYSFVKHIEYDDSTTNLLNVTNGKIEFKNVNFAYEDGEEIFCNFNLTIQAKQKVGIVGYSGSGKTTLINLLLKNNITTSGDILIDEQSILPTSQADVVKYIAYIPQNPLLFNRSIMENIRYANKNASDEEVIQAAKLADLHEEIVDMADGYQTIVGELGSEISGGQRQRIAIARAVLMNAPIVILDEATSALDVETEQTIRNTLDRILQDKTVLVVAHRLSAVSLLDRIIVLDEGKIIEDGSPDALYEKDDGFYKKMVDIHVEDFVD